MGVLRVIGVVLIVAWLVLWLFVKITFAAVHLLFLVGIAMLLFGFRDLPGVALRHAAAQIVNSSSQKPPNVRAVDEMDLQYPVPASARGIRLAQAEWIAVTD